MNWRDWLMLTSLLLILALCLFESCLHCHTNLIREFESVMLSLQRMVWACLFVWCGIFTFLNWRVLDWLLVAFLFISIVIYLFARHPVPGAQLLIFGVTLGKGVSFFLLTANQIAKRIRFLMGLLALLTFSSFLFLNMSGNYYHGPRWMGLWDNPNTYGMLMGGGVALAAGLLMPSLLKNNMSEKLTNADSKKRRRLEIFLGIAIFILGCGLVMSYSRGAWLATMAGLSFLAWRYGKFKWQYILPMVVLAVVTVLFLWSRTPDSAPWYVKRADLGRPSAQHRVSAWRAGVEIMRDHPLGVGWNKAVSLYDTHYSPPEGGAAALTTNDYMMVGTELGIPALLCFITYAGLCYWKGPKLQKLEVRNQEIQAGGQKPELEIQNESEALRAACLAGALVFVVAFWFDGGLFKLATASVFWILLELGKVG